MYFLAENTEYIDEARLDSEICKVCYLVLLKYYSKWECIRMAEARLDMCDLIWERSVVYQKLQLPHLVGWLVSLRLAG